MPNASAGSALNTMSSTCHTFSGGHVFQLLVPPANQKRRAPPGGPGLARADLRRSSYSSLSHASPRTTEHGGVFLSGYLSLACLFFLDCRYTGDRLSVHRVTLDAADKRRAAAADGFCQLPFYVTERAGEGPRVSCVVPWNSQSSGM